MSAADRRDAALMTRLTKMAVRPATCQAQRRARMMVKATQGGVNFTAPGSITIVRFNA